MTIFGTEKIHPYKQKRLVKSNAEAYGRRDSEKALVLVQIKPTRTIAEKHIDGWD